MHSVETISFATTRSRPSEEEGCPPLAPGLEPENGYLWYTPSKHHRVTHCLLSPGLLPLLKSIHKHCNLKKFAGQTIGVDAYGWLHRGTVACAIDLALDKPTTKYGY